MPRSRCIVGVLLALLVSSSGAAQIPATGTPLRVQLTYRDPLAPLDSDYVWDAPAGAPRLEGRLLAWSDSVILLRRDTERQWRIRMTRVDWVAVQSGQGSRGRSAAIFAAAGAATGTAAVLFYSARRFVTNDPDPVHAPVSAYQKGAVIGAGVGALIGAMRPGAHWARIFPR